MSKYAIVFISLFSRLERVPSSTPLLLTTAGIFSLMKISLPFIVYPYEPIICLLISGIMSIREAGDVASTRLYIKYLR